ncbi:hypothetical protein QN277_010453 [Acacia crassicarpa]|uniref:ABC transmembrane type-1 domain-containing protein n=1 Tax=Acacia crassicarpa TaxID=499986 RepID=A0AAE1IQX0_9FABA|nr:hypothetical protein QN277_010453 [Acacia crassicarpa]
MRARYLKAVLRQDVAYFDLHVTSMSEVITNVSNDSLVIQDLFLKRKSEIHKTSQQNLSRLTASMEIVAGAEHPDEYVYVHQKLNISFYNVMAAGDCRVLVCGSARYPWFTLR